MGDADRVQARRLSEQSLQPPLQVPGYGQARFLGRGAFGEVWVATRANTGVRVAIKFFSHRGGVDWSLLSREVEKLRFLFGDRHVVQLIEVGWEADPPFYVMEYLENGSLEERLRSGTMPLEEALPIFREVCIGLQHAHNKGILHCDLKPGNVLLDQDGRPRLADFGQSRLTHEQSPALGTLFYMAPEQADLKAAPNARWDVYALGALFYRMLTGEPPHSRQTGSTQIQKARKLEERLRQYREFIRGAPRASAHRQVPGVDGTLASIIDRCLEVNPARRYPNVQAVLDALDARALRKARRPLLVLGAVGPVLLMLVMAIAGWMMIRKTIDSSTQSIMNRARESNRFAAQSIARKIAGEIGRRWKILAWEANKNRDFRSKLDRALAVWRDRQPMSPRKQSEWWLAQQEQQALQAELEHLHDETLPVTTADNWLILDAEGWVLARSRTTAQKKDVIGSSLRRRDWFHGLGRDFTLEETKREQPTPIKDYHRSTVFQSVVDKTLRVIFSVPIRGPLEKDPKPNSKVLGVLALSVKLDKLRSDFQPQGKTSTQSIPAQFATVVDTKLDWQLKPGLVAEHPILTDTSSQPPRGNVTPLAGSPPDVPSRGKLPSKQYRWEKKDLNWLEKLIGRKKTTKLSLEEQTREKHFDPVGGEYHQPWIAAAEPVFVRFSGREPIDTGWVVLVQERLSAVVGPVDKLSNQLRWQLFLALGFIVLLMLSLWGFVVLVLNSTSRSRLGSFLRRQAGLGSSSYRTGGVATGRSQPPTDRPRSESLRTGVIPRTGG